MYRSITLTSLRPPKEVSRCVFSLNSRTVLIMFAWFIVKAFWMQSAGRGKHASLCSLFNIWNILPNTPTNQYIRTVFVGMCQKKQTSVWWRDTSKYFWIQNLLAVRQQCHASIFVFLSVLICTHEMQCAIIPFISRYWNQNIMKIVGNFI